MSGRQVAQVGSATGLVAAVALFVHAGRAIAEHGDAVAEPVVATADAEDHFPGAALLYIDGESAAPARGSTGTAPLPALPLPPAALLPATFDLGVVAARPFSMGKADAVSRGRAVECLTAAIYYEAAGEPDAGQQAVAQVILNRVRHPAFPDSVCGVVYQGSERTSGCQFSFACDGATARLPSRAGWARAAQVAAMALAGRVYAPVGLATHYHSYAVTPAWNRSLVMTAAVGAHFFHRWQGYWGTSAAFTQRYAGREPVPGRHVQELPALEVATLPAAVMAPVAVMPPAPVRPAEADSATMRNLPTAAGDAQILDRWKDAGKPLQRASPGTGVRARPFTSGEQGEPK